MTLRNRLFAIILLVLILILDQGSKWVVIDIFSASPGVIPVFFGLNLVFVLNYGVSFGMFNDFAYAAYFFSAISILVSLVLAVWLFKTHRIRVLYGLGLVIGGAIGNIIDRFLYGAVVDFIDVYVGSYHWPAFNVADSAICIGAFLLIWDAWYDAKQPKASVEDRE